MALTLQQHERLNLWKLYCYMKIKGSVFDGFSILFFLSLHPGWFQKCWNRQHFAGSKLCWWFNGWFIAGSGIKQQHHSTLLFIEIILVSQQTHMNAHKIQIIMQHYATFIISVHSLHYLLAFGPQSVLHFALSLFQLWYL